MENKYITLQTIYDIVKNDAHPTSTIVFPNEVIVRQNFPWDESIKYIDELCTLLTRGFNTSFLRKDQGVSLN
jgi:hypothetical protein